MLRTQNFYDFKETRLNHKRSETIFGFCYFLYWIIILVWAFQILFCHDFAVKTTIFIYKHKKNPKIKSQRQFSTDQLSLVYFNPVVLLVSHLFFCVDFRCDFYFLSFVLLVFSSFMKQNTENKQKNNINPTKSQYIQLF